jgi:cardiolipin synthase
VLLSFLALVGAAFLLGAAVSLFGSWGRRPTAYRVTDVPPVDSADFLLSVAGAAGAPVRSGGTATLLNNGVQIFPAILQAIRDAKHTVNFAAYIWEDGRASDDLFEALIERARAGVQVRVLLDGVGGSGPPPRKWPPCVRRVVGSSPSGRRGSASSRGSTSATIGGPW